LVVVVVVLHLYCLRFRKKRETFDFDADADDLTEKPSQAAAAAPERLPVVGTATPEYPLNTEETCIVL
jgi:hypothetical protein